MDNTAMNTRKSMQIPLRNKNTPMLSNTKTAKIPIGPKLKAVIAKTGQPKSIEAISDPEKRSFRHLDEFERLQMLKGVKERPYMSTPTFHSTLKMIQEMKLVEDEDPNLTGKLEEKMDSPETRKFTELEKTTKLNFDSRRKLFHSLLHSGSSRISLLEESEGQDLRRRAFNIKPNSKIPDPVPDISYFYTNQDFLNDSCCVPSGSDDPNLRPPPYLCVVGKVEYLQFDKNPFE